MTITIQVNYQKLVWGKMFCSQKKTAIAGADNISASAMAARILPGAVAIALLGGCTASLPPCAPGFTDTGYGYWNSAFHKPQGATSTSGAEEVEKCPTTCATSSACLGYSTYAPSRCYIYAKLAEPKKDSKGRACQKGVCKPDCNAAATGSGSNIYNDETNRCNLKEHIVACSSSDVKLQASIKDGVVSERWTDGHVYKRRERGCLPFNAFKTGGVITGYPWRHHKITDVVREGFAASNGLFTMFTPAAMRSWKIKDSSGIWYTPQNEDDKKYALGLVCHKSRAKTWSTRFWTQLQEYTLKVAQHEHTMFMQFQLHVTCGAMEKYTFCEVIPGGSSSCKVWKQCAPPHIKVLKSAAYPKSPTGVYDLNPGVKPGLLGKGWSGASRINYHSTSGPIYLSQPALETSALFKQTAGAPCQGRCAWY